MNSEEYAIRRLFCIAQMAATLKAGTMANAWNAEHASELEAASAATFAKLATGLFDAVDVSETARINKKVSTEGPF